MEAQEPGDVEGDSKRRDGRAGTGCGGGRRLGVGWPGAVTREEQGLVWKMERGSRCVGWGGAQRGGSRVVRQGERQGSKGRANVQSTWCKRLRAGWGRGYRQFLRLTAAQLQTVRARVKVSSCRCELPLAGGGRSVPSAWQVGGAESRRNPGNCLGLWGKCSEPKPAGMGIR